MATSKAPLIKAAILSALADAPALASVQRSWGHPGDSLAQESIYLGDARSHSDWKYLGTQRRREDPLTVEVIVVVGASGPEQQQTAEERLWELVGEVETALRADPSLDEVINFFTEIDIEQNNVMGENAWACIAALTLTCVTTI